MGSGLILLVIVGAWLAVLVPMALRSHEHAASSRSADRFSDAMRVLRRRRPHDLSVQTVVVPRRGEPAAPARGGEPTAKAASFGRPSLTRRLIPTGGPMAGTRASAGPATAASTRTSVPPTEIPPVRPALTLAARRRRVLAVLLAVTALGLVLGLVGPTSLLVLALVGAALTVGYVAYCRRQSAQGAARRRAAARTGHDGEAQASGADDAPTGAAAHPGWAEPVPAQPAGVPSRMPARFAFAPAAAVVALTVQPAEQPADEWTEDAGAGAETWQPVPVPVPTYVGKAAAPPRRGQVLDLTRPGEWTAALSAEDSVLTELGEGRDIDDILSRRRAVGGW